MTLDARIRAAQERLHRSIGQRARHAHADIRRMAEDARAAVRRHPDFDRLMRILDRVPE